MDRPHVVGERADPDLVLTMVVYDDTLPLVFNHPKLDEVEITVREVTIDTWARYCECGWEALPFDPRAGAADRQRLADAMEIVAGSLVSWNLDQPAEDGGREPIPCDIGGLRSLPKPLVKAILEAWLDAQMGNSDPFEMPSDDGAPLAEIPTRSLAS